MQGPRIDEAWLRAPGKSLAATLCGLKTKGDGECRKGVARMQARMVVGPSGRICCREAKHSLRAGSALC